MTPETIDLLKRESKKISRMPVAKVNIAWAGSSVDLVRLGDVGTVDSFDRLTKSENRVSIADQVISGIGNQKRWAFCETVEGSESFVTLDDDICVMPDNEEDANSRGLLVGWWGTVIAAPNPEFYNNPGYFFGENGSLRQRLQLHFPPMTISRFRLHGYYPDEEKKEWPVNFRVQAFTGYNSTPGPVVNVTGNTDVNYTGEFPTPVTNVTQLEFTIYSWSHAGGFIKVTAAVMDNFDRAYTSDDILSM
ncbi:MAG: hypothetical protein LBB56_08150, partial [Chitinispirillales bacterium]|nr:hypothetical protein [Chitinispirillales bacterium]